MLDYEAKGVVDFQRIEKNVEYFRRISLAVGYKGYRGCKGDAPEVLNILSNAVGNHNPLRFTVQDSTSCTYGLGGLQLQNEPTPRVSFGTL